MLPFLTVTGPHNVKGDPYLVAWAFCPVGAAVTVVNDYSGEVLGPHFAPDTAPPED